MQPHRAQGSPVRNTLRACALVTLIVGVTAAPARAADAPRRTPPAKVAQAVQAAGAASSAKPYIGTPADGNGIRNTTPAAARAADKGVTNPPNARPWLDETSLGTVGLAKSPVQGAIGEGASDVNARQSAQSQARKDNAPGAGQRAKSGSDAGGGGIAPAATSELQKGPQPRSGVLQESEFVDWSINVREGPGTAGSSPTTPRR